jgi:hypothetical protein
LTSAFPVPKKFPKSTNLFGSGFVWGGFCLGVVLLTWLVGGTSFFTGLLTGVVLTFVGGTGFWGGCCTLDGGALGAVSGFFSEVFGLDSAIFDLEIS